MLDIFIDDVKLSGGLVKFDQLYFISGTGVRVTADYSKYQNRALISIGATGGGGTVWYTGAGAPVGLHIDGDFYLNTTNGDYYEQVTGVWVLQGNLTGPTGSTGSTGATGATGAAGAAGASGVVPIATAAGTANAITATYSPVLTLTDKMLCAFVATAANSTTTPTFSPDGLTAHTIVKNGGQPLLAGDIPAALAVCIVEYNLANTRWELLNPAYGKTNSNIAKGNVIGIFDGMGGVLTANNYVEVVVPYAGTITDWVIDSYSPISGAAVSGSIIIELYRSGASIIGAGNKPTLSSASTNSAAVSGWTSTAVAAGDKLVLYISGSPTSCLKATVAFNITKTS